MDAILYDVVKIGTIIYKTYYFDKELAYNEHKVKEVLLEYDTEQKICSLRFNSTEEISAIYDFTDNPDPSYDVKLDKKLFHTLFKHIFSISKEVPDYPELYNY